MGYAKTDLLTPLQQLEAVPETEMGEVIRGVLHTKSRPVWRHLKASKAISFGLDGPFSFDPSGPGGWVFASEPLIEFEVDTLLIPDIAGWRRERLMTEPEGHVIETIPDWVCEILSPSTASRDLHVKLPIFEKAGVEFVWYVDPAEKTLSAFQKIDGRMTLIAALSGDEADVSIPPFDAVSFPLAQVWK